MHCITDHMTVSTFLVERNVIDESPPYQRQGAIWSTEKRQLFVDSILNNFDVPKIYLHDLRGHDPVVKFAVIDGKQRLDAIRFDQIRRYGRIFRGSMQPSEQVRGRVIPVVVVGKKNVRTVVSQTLDKERRR